jgi:hypothetical protein
MISTTKQKETDAMKCVAVLLAASITSASAQTSQQRPMVAVPTDLTADQLTGPTDATEPNPTNAAKPIRPVAPSSLQRRCTTLDGKSFAWSHANVPSAVLACD